MSREESDELLRLADHVDVLVRFCAVNMPVDRVEQYRAGSAAFWAIVHKLAGDETAFAKLRAEVPADVVLPPNQGL